MAAEEDVNELIEQFQLAQGEPFKGNPEPMKMLWSSREDVSLAVGVVYNVRAPKECTRGSGQSCPAARTP
jgi:hypothetical protein